MTGSKSRTTLALTTFLEADELFFVAAADIDDIGPLTLQGISQIADLLLLVNTSSLADLVSLAFGLSVILVPPFGLLRGVY